MMYCLEPHHLNHFSHWCYLPYPPYLTVSVMKEFYSLKKCLWILSLTRLDRVPSNWAWCSATLCSLLNHFCSTMATLHSHYFWNRRDGWLEGWVVRSYKRLRAVRVIEFKYIHMNTAPESRLWFFITKMIFFLFSNFLFLSWFKNSTMHTISSI